jgi:uncharacterized membrane protein
LAHICAWGCSEYSIVLSINLFQSLVYKVLCVAAEKKRERKRKNKRKKMKEVPAIQKKLAAEKESSCC